MSGLDRAIWICAGSFLAFVAIAVPSNVPSDRVLVLVSAALADVALFALAVLCIMKGLM